MRLFKKNKTLQLYRVNKRKENMFIFKLRIVYKNKRD